MILCVRITSKKAHRRVTASLHTDTLPPTVHGWKVREFELRLLRRFAGKGRQVLPKGRQVSPKGKQVLPKLMDPPLPPPDSGLERCRLRPLGDAGSSSIINRLEFRANPCTLGPVIEQICRQKTRGRISNQDPLGGLPPSIRKRQGWPWCPTSDCVVAQTVCLLNC